MRGAALAMAVLLAGCGGDDPYTLAVDVKTDLIAGIEFTTVRVTLVAGERRVGQEERGAFVGEEFVRAVRVGEIDGLASGSYRMDAELIAADGRVVLARPVALDIRGDTIVLVVLTRDCRMVSCPPAAGPA